MRTIVCLVSVALAGLPVDLFAQDVPLPEPYSLMAFVEPNVTTDSVQAAPLPWLPPEEDADGAGRATMIAAETVAGVLGAIVVSIPATDYGEQFGLGNGESPGIWSAILGFLAGSTLGSALGVQIAGDQLGDNGKFGSTLLGSFAGTIMFTFLLAPGLDSDYAPFFVAAWGLPSAGAVLGYQTSGNSTRSRRSSRSVGGMNVLLEPQAGGGLDVGLSVEF